MSQYWWSREAFRERDALRCALALGIDTGPYLVPDSRGHRGLTGVTLENLEAAIRVEATLRAPCRECHTFDNERDGALTCVPCADRLNREEQARFEENRRLFGVGRRVGRYMPDGHGCVTRTTLADRVALGEVNPYE